MKKFIVYFFLVCITCTCSLKKEPKSQHDCPCNSIKICSFYSKMEAYLINKKLLTNSNYYKLIKDLEEKKIIINPLDIWKDNIDANAALLLANDKAEDCFDSLYRLNPKQYADGRRIIQDFTLTDLGISLDDSVLLRASSSIDLNESNRFALQQYLWATILQMDAIRLNAEYN